jgi:hypothetical protein
MFWEGVRLSGAMSGSYPIAAKHLSNTIVGLCNEIKVLEYDAH